MLKKFSHIVLSLLLLLATTGMAVSKHYCGDALVDVALNKNAESCCNDGACCHNETQVYQLDEDFSAPQVLSNPELHEMTVFGFALLTIDQTPAVQQLKTFKNNNSPPAFKVDEILSLNQVFLL